MKFFSKLLCLIGCHDWRQMNGRCCECGKVDDLWRPAPPEPPQWFKDAYQEYLDEVKRGGPR